MHDTLYLMTRHFKQMLSLFFNHILLAISYYGEKLCFLFCLKELVSAQ